MRPLHKTEAKDNMNNYRPISVLNAISKVLERIVYDQLYNYLNKYNLLSKSQSGFRPIHSTATTLLDATTDWLISMDQGNMNLVILLDLAKAFDTVTYDILIGKLSAYGVRSNSLLWFKSYLKLTVGKGAVSMAFCQVSVRYPVGCLKVQY